MRTPARGRNIAAAFTVVFAGVVAWPFVLPSSMTNPGAAGASVSLGLCAVIVSAIFWVQLHLSTKRYYRLIAGEGLLTQWMVPPGQWREFVAYHVELAKLNPQYVNYFKLTDKPHADGVEVILGERAVIVDGNYQEIPTVANDSSFEALELIVGPPMFINMHIVTVTQTKSGARRSYYALRFPVAAEAHADAVAAVTVYVNKANALALEKRSLVGKYPVVVRRITLVIAVLAGIGGVIGFYCRNQPQILDQSLALGLALVGVLVTPVALILAAVAHRNLSRQRKAKAAEAEATAAAAKAS